MRKNLSTRTSSNGTGMYAKPKTLTVLEFELSLFNVLIPVITIKFPPSSMSHQER